MAKPGEGPFKANIGGRKILAVQYNHTGLAKMEWKSKWNVALKKMHMGSGVKACPRRQSIEKNKINFQPISSVRGRPRVNSVGKMRKGEATTSFYSKYMAAVIKHWAQIPCQKDTLATKSAYGNLSHGRLAF